MPKPVEAPAQVPLRTGLFTVADVDFNFDFDLDGISFRPESCGSGGIIELCPDDPVTKTITAPDGPTTRPAYALWEGDECSTLTGRAVYNTTRERVVAKLERKTQNYVENALWTGAPATAITDNSALASTAATDVTPGTTAGIVPAIAAMIEGLDDALEGGRGIIHVPQFALPWLRFYGLVTRVGNVLQVTDTDHVYVAGSGYPNTDPDGNVLDLADGYVWFYGTGAVRVKLSTISVIPEVEYQAIDRSVNNVEVRAERAAAAYFDPCAHLAVEACIPDPGPACGEQSS